MLTAALSNRLRELSILLQAGKAMNALLELDAVLDVILPSSLELLTGKSGSLMLLAGDELVARSAINSPEALGRRVSIGEGIAGRVARTKEPPASAQPVRGAGRRRDRERAAVRRRTRPRGRARRARPDEERVPRPRDARAQHATVVLAAAQTGSEPEPSMDRDELFRIIERNARHLAAMVEDLLAAAPLDQVVVDRTDEAAMLSVLDADQGLPPDERDRLFERFYRAGQTGKPGLRLGVAVVRGLAACGGHVWAEDAPGGGAAFRVALPLRTAELETV